MTNDTNTSSTREAGAVEPVAWIRFCSDGLYEGPIHDCQIDEIRRRSGVWTPLVPMPDYDTLRAQLEAANAKCQRLREVRLQLVQDHSDMRDRAEAAEADAARFRFLAAQPTDEWISDAGDSFRTLAEAVDASIAARTKEAAP